jgi:hypothetical protein
MKISKIERPLRDPDHVSKRGVFYWFSPEWVRGTTSANDRFGKIKAILENGTHGMKGTVNLYMVSKEDKLTYIQGSIQEEFKRWHLDRQIDYILLGETAEAASELIITETEDTKYA